MCLKRARIFDLIVKPRALLLELLLSQFRKDASEGWIDAFIDVLRQGCNRGKASDVGKVALPFLHRRRRDRHTSGDWRR